MSLWQTRGDSQTALCCISRASKKTFKMQKHKPEGLFDQPPSSPGEHHPANYLSYISERMRRFRQTLDISQRSEEGFGQMSLVNILENPFRDPRYKELKMAERAPIGAL